MKAKVVVVVHACEADIVDAPGFRIASPKVECRAVVAMNHVVCMEATPDVQLA